MNEKTRISISISLKFVPKGQINNIPALVWNQWWSVYWRIYASLGLNDLNGNWCNTLIFYRKVTKIHMFFLFDTPPLVKLANTVYNMRIWFIQKGSEMFGRNFRLGNNYRSRCPCWKSFNIKTYSFTKIAQSIILLPDLMRTSLGPHDWKQFPIKAKFGFAGKHTNKSLQNNKLYISAYSSYPTASVSDILCLFAGYPYHIVAGTNWPTLCSRHFQIHSFD